MPSPTKIPAAVAATLTLDQPWLGMISSGFRAVRVSVLPLVSDQVSISSCRFCLGVSPDQQEGLQAVQPLPQKTAESLKQACLPGLILQPLVENAIKHGVSRASRPVTIAIAARSEAGRLVVTVSDNGNPIESDGESGSGIGLANVRDRLAARFGREASIEWLAPEGGGFVVRLILPEVHRGC